MERSDWLKTPAAKIVDAEAPHAGQALETHWQSAYPAASLLPTLTCSLPRRSF